jgi:hypothetical protein
VASSGNVGKAEDLVQTFLYKLSGETWVAVHHAVGATDVWFAWGPLCREYGAVIADYCQGVAYD